jgi:hypothetical protein
MKNILLTTQHRGVFFAQVEDSTDLTTKMLTNLKNCRMAIYWATTKGVLELASDGPNESSKIGAAADVDVMHDITAVFSVSDKAAEKWLNHGV